ncbi:MAG TPA: hypothetical protein VFH68_25065 [Polyangia bacterium]|nr:hypothetical protein [Polyangia bacterium]
MRRTGTWPADTVNRELVTLSAQGLPRAEAIRRLADKAGWSVVVVQGATSGIVDVQVKKQPAAKVLELILADGSYLAHRDGDLIAIAPLGARAAAAKDDDDDDDADDGGHQNDNHNDNDGDHTRSAPEPAGTFAPGPAEGKREKRPHGKDRVVTGSSVTIGRDEVVGDLVVMGGSAEVLGRVSGDVAVFAGSVHIREGGRVFGDVATFGGSVELDQGSRVDGDLSVIGGSVDRHDKAIVGGESQGAAEDGDDAAEDGDKNKDHPHQPRHSSPFSSAAAAVGGAITRTALLFAFGAMLWALAGRRLERIQDEVAARPMRSFALGIVGMLGALLALVVLCVTIIGIPVALLAVLASVLGTYAGVCAVLTTAGALLLRQRTSSPYVHLAFGCGVYLVLSSIPFVGHFVTAAVALIGFGALVATRAAGLIKLRRASPT